MNEKNVLHHIDSNLDMIVLVSGTLDDGTPHFAYVSIPPSKYDAFKEAEAKGNYRLAEFGTILRHGKGLKPSAEIEQEMIENYAVSHQFEKAFQATRKILSEQI